MQEPQQKKSFWYIYLGVIIAYVVLAIVYGVVIHKATEDGAKDIAPVKPKDDDNSANKVIEAFQTFVNQMIQ